MSVLGGAARGLRPETCLEKSDMVQQIVDSGTVDILPEVSEAEAGGGAVEETAPEAAAAAGAEVETPNTAATPEAAGAEVEAAAAAATAIADAAVAALTGTLTDEVDNEAAIPGSAAAPIDVDIESTTDPTAPIYVDTDDEEETTAAAAAAAASAAFGSAASEGATTHEGVPGVEAPATPAEGGRAGDAAEEVPIDEILERAMEESMERESSSTAGNVAGNGDGSRPTMTLGELNALGISALRSTMAAHGVDATGCVFLLNPHVFSHIVSNSFWFHCFFFLAVGLIFPSVVVMKYP